VSGVDVETPRCTCPDFEERQQPCKHIYAVRIVIQREFSFDGEAVTERETVTITKTVKRTYPQNWPAYNAAQTNEKDRFMVLLRDLCAGLPEPEQKRGRPRLSVKDSVFTAVMKGLHDGIRPPQHERSARGPRTRLHRQASVPQFRAQRAGESRPDADPVWPDRGERPPAQGR